MNTEEILSSLCGAFGGAGNETAVLKTIKELLPGYKTAEDAMGNLGAEIAPKKPGRPTVMLTAHTDEISFMVRKVRDDGTLLLNTVGGIDRRVLCGLPVTVFTAGGEIRGVISSAESELNSETLCADIFCKKEDSPAAPGDRVRFYAPFTDMGNGCVTSNALDNRAGCAALIKAAEGIRTPADFGIYLLFAAQEEIGLRASGAGTVNIAPDIAVAVDVSFGSCPGVEAHKTGEFGGGPMIGVSPILSQKLTKRLIETARQRSIPYSLEIMSGATGTDGDRISGTGGGVSTALVSIPIHNMHTPAETVLIEDINSAAKLLAAFVNSIGGQKI